jgi:hypothetical protein
MSELSKALFEVQKEVGGGVKKDATNSHFGNEYTTLGAIVRRVLPILNSHGVLMSVATEYVPDVRCVGTTLTLVHVETDEKAHYTKLLPMGDRLDPQAMGSASTYAQRYLLQEVFMLPPVDDDGEAAMQRSKSPKITEKQLDDLVLLYKEAGVERETVCKAAQVTLLNDIKVADYDKIVERLKAKIRGSKDGD